jgi:hypothetical protein
MDSWRMDTGIDDNINYWVKTMDWTKDPLSRNRRRLKQFALQPGRDEHMLELF